MCFTTASPGAATVLTTTRRGARRHAGLFTSVLCLLAVSSAGRSTSGGAQAEDEANAQASAPTNGPAAAPVAGPMAITFLNSGQLPATVPFSEGVRIGNLVLLSGQLGAKPGEMTVVPGGIDAEARQTLDNIRRTLEQHGLTMNDVVKCTVLLADMSEWAAFNTIYASYFTPPYPARSALGTSGLALGARVELECIAADGAAAAHDAR